MRALVVAALLMLAIPAHAGEFDPDSVYKVPTGASPVSGPADAAVTVVVWSDYACGYCARSQSTLESLVRLYPDQIRFVHRIFPLDDEDTIASQAALAAAAQGKFEPMHDRLYNVFGQVDRVDVELFARELGLDMVKFRADLDAAVYAPQIAADVADARALGISATPVFFINGRPLAGSQPLKAFIDVVDGELATARNTKTVVPYETLVEGGKPSADMSTKVKYDFELDATTTYRLGLGLPGHQMGPDTALVTIVAWGDFQCPFCAKMAPTLAGVQRAFPADVRVVYRHLPMSFHRRAPLAAEAAVAAAAQGKFWAFHDAVYNQFGRLTREDLEDFAEEAGLDMPAFRAALEDRRYHDAVIAEGAAAEALGVDGTPTVFVNGKPVIGTRDIPQLTQVVEVELAAARQAVNAGIAPGDVYALLMSAGVGEDRSDPSRIPDVAGMTITPRADDRGRSVAAACRLKDSARAVKLATGLSGPVKQRVSRACAAGGIDLP